jgi:hypothetical protein
VFSVSLTEVVQLPIFGQLCLKVHNGYKIFNLSDNTVTKVFKETIMPRKIEYEIDLLRKVGEHDFAPTLLQWNTKGRWYVEELINGHHPDRSNWRQFLRTYNTVVTPLLKKLILASTPEPVEVLQYVKRLDTAIRGQHSKLSGTHLEPLKVNFIKNFIQLSLQELHLQTCKKIFIVFSHGGGATPRHILINETQVVILDWENSGNRSALHDLYDNFFERIWGNPLIPGMEREMQKAIQDLQATLLTSRNTIFQELAESLNSYRVYQLIYYIERVWSYVSPSPELTEGDLERIVRITDAFSRFEEARKRDFFNSQKSSKLEEQEFAENA